MAKAARQDRRAANRTRRDERVGIHLGPGGCGLAALRAGQGRLDAIVEADPGPVAGLRVLHLQGHGGADTLALAQRGAQVVGLDVSAIAAARGLATAPAASGPRCTKAPAALPEPGRFGLAVATRNPRHVAPCGRRDQSSACSASG
ncbi:hypothetical protein ACFQS7_12580 [Dankookia sp. GCM10030260]|uniref:hypothetical protein n=1 Tax=Dankookia sp. GCM10030260 TaxID=3273390 RepID=UPI003610837D